MFRVSSFCAQRIRTSAILNSLLICIASVSARNSKFCPKIFIKFFPKFFKSTFCFSAEVCTSFVAVYILRIYLNESSRNISLVVKRNTWINILREGNIRIQIIRIYVSFREFCSDKRSFYLSFDFRKNSIFRSKDTGRNF